MLKGILFGLVMQVISAVGYLIIANALSIKNEFFRTGLMICFACVVAVIVMVYTVTTGTQKLSEIERKDYLYIAIGSIMVMFIAQVIFFFGVQASNMTTMSYTMLAFPIISLILELIVGRIKLSSLGIHDLVGFALMVAGYMVFMTKPAA